MNRYSTIILAAIFVAAASASCPTGADCRRARIREPDDRGTQADVHHRQEQPPQDGGEDAGGALRLQGHGGHPLLRPAGRPRRRLSGPNLLRANGEQKALNAGSKTSKADLVRRSRSPSTCAIKPSIHSPTQRPPK